MSDYPGAIDDFRTIENIPNQTYDSAKTTTIYAEDLTALDEAVVAIEETLGTDPQGDESTVDDRIAALENKFANLKIVTAQEIVNGNASTRTISGLSFAPMYIVVMRHANSTTAAAISQGISGADTGLGATSGINVPSNVAATHYSEGYPFLITTAGGSVVCEGYVSAWNSDGIEITFDTQNNSDFSVMLIGISTE